MKQRSTDHFCSSAGKAGPIAVNATADVRTHSKYIGDGDQFVLLARATGTNPDIDLYLEQGPGLPTTEGAAGDSSDGWTLTGSKIADLTDNTWKQIALSPSAMPYARILIDGQGSNPADSTVELKIMRQTDLT